MVSKIRSFKNSVIRSILRSRKRISRKRSSNNITVDSGKSQRRILTGRVILIVLVTGICLLLIDTTSFYVRFSFNEASGTKLSKTTWNGNDRINILIIGIDKKKTGHVFVDFASVLHLSPNKPSFSIFSINPKFNTLMPNGEHSTVRLSYMMGLDNSDSVGYVIAGVENLVGMKIQKYVLIDQDQAMTFFNRFPLTNIIVKNDIVDPDFEPIYAGQFGIDQSQYYDYLASDIAGEDNRLKRNVIFLKDEFSSIVRFFNITRYKGLLNLIKDNIYTNIKKYELIQMAMFFKSLRSDQIIVAFTQEKSGIKSISNLYNWRPVFEDIDANLKIILINHKVMLEQARIEILNASKLSGVATAKSRWVENVGGRVIRVGNSPNEYNKNYIFVKNPEDFPETIKEIKTTFKNEVRVLREEYPNRHVGDIVVIIGNPSI